jgi:nucleoside-diphosphate-sugar epimerase
MIEGNSEGGPRRAFVTGGSGFVGRHLVPMLLAQGFSVRALVRSAEAERALAALGAETALGGLDDAAALQAAMAGCDVVFHLAAHVREWGPVADFLAVNVEGTKNALSSAKAAKVARFIHASTEAVLLGSGPLVEVDEARKPVDHPPGLYPWTKMLAERAVLDANDDGFATIVVRPRFVWGKGDTTLLPKIAEAARAGRFAWIGGGHHRTSTCHVKNVCEGLIAASERGKGGEIYFLTDGAPTEMKAFVGAMLATQGVDAGDRSMPLWLGVALGGVCEAVWRGLGLKGDPPVTRTAALLFGQEVTVMDSRARSEIGYVGHVTREAGLDEMRASAPVPTS